MILVDQNGVCCLCVDGKGHGMEEATAVLVSRIQRAVMLGQVRYQVIFHNRDSRTCIDGARLEYDCIDSNKIYLFFMLGLRDMNRLPLRESGKPMFKDGWGSHSQCPGPVIFSVWINKICTDSVSCMQFFLHIIRDLYMVVVAKGEQLIRTIRMVGGIVAMWCKTFTFT